MGKGGLAAELKNFWTHVLVKYRAYGELKAYLQETSSLDYSVADEESLKRVARNFAFPALFS